MSSEGYQATSNAEHPKMVITKKRRQLQLLQLFVIVLVSIGTVALTIVDVIQTAKSFQKKEQLTDNISGSTSTALIIHNLQKERGLTALQMGFQQLNFEEERIKLDEIRRETNESVSIMEKKDENDLRMLTESKVSFLFVLEDFRRTIDRGETGVIHHLETYRSWIMKLISTLVKYTESANLEDFANLVYAYEMLILSKEEAGMERALGGLKFTQGKNFSNSTWYNEKRVLGQNYLKTALLFSNELKNMQTMLTANASDWLKEIEMKRTMLSSESLIKSSNTDAYEWFNLMTKYNNLMLDLQKKQADLIVTRVKAKIRQSTYQLVVRSLLLCFALIVVPAIIFSLANVQKNFYKYTLSLFDKVGLEQARTDFLMQQNARYVDNLAEKWKGFSSNGAVKQTNTASNKTCKCVAIINENTSETDAA